RAGSARRDADGAGSRGLDRRGRRAPDPAEADDGGRDDRRAAAATLEHGHRRRRDEADRGADGRRARELGRTRTVGVSGGVRAMEAAVASQPARAEGRMKWSARRVGLGAIALGLAIQLVPYRPARDNPPVLGEPAWDSPRTRELFYRACKNCHSHETE